MLLTLLSFLLFFLLIGISIFSISHFCDRKKKAILKSIVLCIGELNNVHNHLNSILSIKRPMGVKKKTFKRFRKEVRYLQIRNHKLIVKLVLLLQKKDNLLVKPINYSIGQYEKAIQHLAIVTALLFKGNDNTLSLPEKSFIHGVCRQSIENSQSELAKQALSLARRSNWQNTRQEYQNHLDISAIDLNLFYTEFTQLVSQTTNQTLFTIQELESLINTTRGFTTFHERGHYIYNYSSPEYISLLNDAKVMTWHHILQKLLDQRLDIMAHKYFGLWARNYSISDRDREIIQNLYQSYLLSRYNRDLSYISHKFNCDGKLLNLMNYCDYHKYYIFDPIHKFSFSYSQNLSMQSKIKGLENSDYMKYASNHDIESFRRLISNLQNIPSIDPELNLDHLMIGPEHEWKVLSYTVQNQDIGDLIDLLLTLGIIST